MKEKNVSFKIEMAWTQGTLDYRDRKNYNDNPYKDVDNDNFNPGLIMAWDEGYEMARVAHAEVLLETYSALDLDNTCYGNEG